MGEETIDIGGEWWVCHVIEATLKPASSPDLKELKPSSPPPKPSDDIFELVFIMAKMLDFADVGSESFYVLATGEPLHLKMWVDKTRHIALRSNITSTWYKKQGRPRKGEEEIGERVKIELVDTFTVTKVDESLPDELFKFTPPANAQ